MSRARAALLVLLGCWFVGCGGDGTHVGPSWLADARIFVQGYGVTNMDCRAALCQHDENTDMVVWNGATWLIHRTAKSQILGDDSSLHIYRSDDHGGHFIETAKILALTGRDLRDPHFFVVGSDLYFLALTRLPVTSSRDSDVETISYAWQTSDGTNWTQLPDQLAPTEWSLWRPKQNNGVWYSAAYHDGDTSVKLFSSSDGATWTAGADVYTVSDDTPLETELVFMPSGALLALVRMDGTDQELLGSEGRLRTKVCWAQPPYDSFDCPQEIMDQRLDGPLAFFWKQRLFVVARKHLGEDGRKRTSAVRADRRLHRRWDVGDSRVGRAAVGGRHLLRRRRGGRRQSRATQLVLGRPGARPELGHRHLRRQQHLARHRGLFKSEVSGPGNRLAALISHWRLHAHALFGDSRRWL